MHLSLLHSVNLILFTILLVHLILRISPHHSHHLRSHHLSLSRPFTPDLKNTHLFHKSSSVIFISLFIQQQNSTNTVTNVGTNEVETGMTRLIVLTDTAVY